MLHVVELPDHVDRVQADESRHAADPLEIGTVARNARRRLARNDLARDDLCAAGRDQVLTVLDAADGHVRHEACAGPRVAALRSLARFRKLDDAAAERLHAAAGFQEPHLPRQDGLRHGRRLYDADPPPAGQRGEVIDRRLHLVVAPLLRERNHVHRSQWHGAFPVAVPELHDLLEHVVLRLPGNVARLGMPGADRQMTLAAGARVRRFSVEHGRRRHWMILRVPVGGIQKVVDLPLRVAPVAARHVPRRVEVSIDEVLVRRIGDGIRPGRERAGWIGGRALRRDHDGHETERERQRYSRDEYLHAVSLPQRR